MTAPVYGDADPSAGVGAGLGDAVAGHGLRPVFQPIVTLPEGNVVGFEALARWATLGEPTPEAVFAHAAGLGQEHQLEQACIHAAIQGASSAGMGAANPLFLNCLPATPHVDRAHDDILARGAQRLQLIFEITEHRLLAHPSAVLNKVAALRADGFAIALDDVGATLESLALLDVIAPEVIKLDLALIQSRPRYQQARTWAAVLDHHEQSGAVILAEGIETLEHLRRALSLGATLGQGYLFGHPGPLDLVEGSPRPWSLPVRTRRPPLHAGSPFEDIAASVPIRTERKDTVLALSRYLEQQALKATDPPMVLTALQRAEFFPTSTARVHHRLAATSPLVVVFGKDLHTNLGFGVRGVPIEASDPLSRQWIVLTLGATTCAALIAQELDDDGALRRDGDRRFQVALTNDRTLVTNAARHLLARLPHRTGGT